MIAVENRGRVYLVGGLTFLYAIINLLCVYCALPATPLSALLIHTVLRALLLMALVLLSHFIFAFGNYHTLPLVQRYVVMAGLFLLFIGLFFGIGYLLDYLTVGHSACNDFIVVYPFYSLVLFLIFIIIVLLRQPFNAVLRTEDNEAPDDEAEIGSNNPLQNGDTADPLEPTELLERIAVKSGAKIHVIQTDDILYLRADGDYVQIHSREGRFLKEQTMKYFQERLPAQQFVRVHRSAIVNVEQISRIETFEKQNQLLTLKNGDKIRMSLGGYKRLREVLGL